MRNTKTRLLLLAVVLVLSIVLVPGVAMANNGPHGGFTSDTDQCAACHRAHTAPSNVQWHKGAYSGSALLLGTSNVLPDFCLTCHGASAQGADTNVLDGIYEGELGGGYGTPGAALISGPFGRYDSGTDTWVDYANRQITSTHGYGYNPADPLAGAWGAWGGGFYGLTAASAVNTWTGDFIFGEGTRGSGFEKIPMDCATCHDVHGTSNYRLLRDTVYGVKVGGYNAITEAPEAFVESAEFGFPAGGFALHTKYSGYIPNYTTPRYARPPGDDQDLGMSGWCVGCHTFYMGKGTTVTPGDPNNESRATTYAAESVYTPASYGNVVRHRHPVNVPLTNFNGNTTLTINAAVTPLLHEPVAGRLVAAGSALPADNTDYIDCLSCHYAHGTTATMTGYAVAGDPTNPVPNDNAAGRGVPPTDDSALLRENNRTACEACHNK